MDKCREAFEKWYEFEHGEKVYWSDMPLHQFYLFSAWQEQQKRIDELQARLDGAYVKLAMLRQTELWREDDIYELFEELEQALKGGEV